MEQKMRHRNLFRRNSFDENWRFTRGDVPGAEQSNFEDSAWSVVHLPHDWSIAGPFSQDHPSGGGGGYLPGGIGWYRKTFEWAQADQNKTIRIEFDGVYKNCDVWINGHHLGFHPYGYTSFAYELTPYLRPRKERAGGTRGQLAAARCSLVQRLRHLPPHLAGHHRPAPCGPLGHLRDDPGGFRNHRHGIGAHSPPQCRGSWNAPASC